MYHAPEARRADLRDRHYLVVARPGGQFAVYDAASLYFNRHPLRGAFTGANVVLPNYNSKTRPLLAGSARQAVAFMRQGRLPYEMWPAATRAILPGGRGPLPTRPPQYVLMRATFHAGPPAPAAPSTPTRARNRGARMSFASRPSVSSSESSSVSSRSSRSSLSRSGSWARRLLPRRLRS